jgi:hypothetical protein
MKAPPITHEYDLEIADLTRQINRLLQEEGDQELIVELEREREVLRALLQSALRLWDLGDVDPELRQAFEATQSEPWGFPEVYSFVYEQAVLIDTGGDHESFVRGIRALRPERELREGPD